MKCDELKRFDIVGKYRDEETMYEFRPDGECYDADEVDAAIAELKDENERLVKCCKEYDIRQRIDERIKFNGAQQLRSTKRALWLARASEASKEVNYWTCQDESSYAIVDFNVRHETIVSYKAPHHRPYKWILIWENVERKCRAKAKEYK